MFGRSVGGRRPLADDSLARAETWASIGVFYIRVAEACETICFATDVRVNRVYRFSDVYFVALFRSRGWIVYQSEEMF